MWNAPIQRETHQPNVRCTCQLNCRIVETTFSNKSIEKQGLQPQVEHRTRPQGSPTPSELSPQSPKVLPNGRYNGPLILRDLGRLSQFALQNIPAHCQTNSKSYTFLKKSKTLRQVIESWINSAYVLLFLVFYCYWNCFAPYKSPFCQCGVPCQRYCRWSHAPKPAWGSHIGADMATSKW